MHMVKVISLSEEAYRTLRRMKKVNMSFSDTIIENFSKFDEKKTENLSDLISWLNIFHKVAKKQKISKNADNIIYGVSK